jgi:hypothetical protein
MHAFRPRARRPRLLLLLSLAAATVHCGPTRLESVPPELIGTWRAPKRYAKSFLEIRADAFVLGSGQLELGVFPIEFVDTHSGPEHATIYQLHHRAHEGYEDVLVLTYAAQTIPTLRVGASPEPWTRAPSD